MRFVSTLALAAGLTASAAAATADGNARIVGAGGAPCSQITADMASNPAAAGEVGSWLMGYATATNRQIADTWDLLGAGGADAFIAAVQAACVAAPDKNLESVAFEVLKGDYANRQALISEALRP